ncbi:MAG: DNA polymerase III subunit gamma/tau [Eubacterium sp.]|nr:DNA polymerase III subunit gamma/tau [Eubacterium sp.]MCI8918999.1 DNA polymerase III subunit gamma/tau [Eubacterium sp.]
MSYTALYRKYRPQSFEDVRGQDHIVTTIRNQIKAGRIGHAYLFCGTRGTGKTTVAKIFARAVNCEHPIDGSPCGECQTCRAIRSGNSLNVIEIDAASNNGVDNIREIRDEVTYAPTEGRYKVYIIDEVHMLTSGAFNALLKTLEEPPSYVIFVLATTEAHKIPVTILSRCQRYDFHRISVDTISERLHELLEQEQGQADDKALRYIAKAADGAMRDALSLLDQCMAFYMGQKLTYDHVLEVLGAVDTERFSQLLRTVINSDVLSAMRQIEGLISEGRDLGQFINDFIWYLRSLLLLKSSDNMEDVLDISSENLVLMKEECRLVDSSSLMRDIRILSELSNQVKYSAQKRILIEIGIIKMCCPQMEEDNSSILARLQQMEQKMEQWSRAGISMQAAPDSSSAAQSVNSSAQMSAKQPQPRQLAEAVTEDVRQVVQNWRSIVSEMPNMARICMSKAHLSISGDNLLMIVLEDTFDSEMLLEEKRQQEIKDLISNSIGRKIQVQMQINKTGRPFQESYVDLEQKINMDIVYEDD